MARRIGLVIACIIAAALLFLYAAGRGWLGAQVSAGEPLEVARSAETLEREEALQASAAEEVGSFRAKEILFGDFHVHTSFSPDAFTMGLPLSGGTGSHTVSDACDFARYCSSLDFWSVNDHAEASTQRRWQETIDAVRQCDAVGSGGEGVEASPDLISFLGWEWSHMGTTAENHYGHRNIVLRDLDDEHIPTRPIASDSPAQYMTPPSTALLATLIAVSGDPEYFRYANYQQETSATERCADDVPVRDLPADCRELAATPGELYRKLDDWGFESLSIPHGSAWGIYTPQGSGVAKQLNPEDHDPVRQRLVEVYSGHGNIEEYRGWKEVVIDEDGARHCPSPSENFIPGCWQAGEIIRTRCLAADESDEICEERAVAARQHYADAPSGMGHLSVPAFRADEWLDSAQCQDCFLPAFSYRSGSTVQEMLALSRPGEDGVPQRFRFGIIGSSDIHTARPGTGYKDILRTKMADVRTTRVSIPGGTPTEDAAPVSRVADPTGLAPSGWLERERAGSFFYTGGLVAVHAAKRDRNAIWDGLQKRETYATSGPRILLWFDLLNPPAAGGRRVGEALPMGSEVAMDEAPIFQVRAAGSREQMPGCPEESKAALSEERLERLCGGECYFPSDTRRLITRVEIVRIRPQLHAAEVLEPLIEDPWRVIECEPNPDGCVVTFTDPDFVVGQRDVTYYARAIEEPSLAVNGDQLRCDRNEQGECETINPCDPWAPDTDDCLASIEERAWSSPIFVTQATEQE
ncbi:MAG: hypothetical protein ACI9QQ_001979 [Myxococcota bacterium]|jgi:hypothetical protein